MTVKCDFEYLGVEEKTGRHLYRCRFCDKSKTFSKNHDAKIITGECGPNLLQRSTNFVVAGAKHLATGAKTVSQEIIDQRFAICQACPGGFYDAERERCIHKRCGCGVTSKKGLLQKLSWADQACPERYWTRVVPEAPPVVKTAEFTEPVRRNFIMHIWPVSGHGAWQWNCDQILQRASLFNGKRVVAIVTSKETDSAEAVKEYLCDFTDEFIVLPNNPTLREVLTFVPMLEKVQSTEPNEVTFSCHAKCVRHRVGVDDPRTPIFRWTQVMYESCLDYWPVVREQLTTKAMTGDFKRYGEFKTTGNHRWHYSGTFYWFRNRDVFSRNWRNIDQQWFGTEAWPGLMFRGDETGCLFMDNADDVYQQHYWTEKIEPAWEEWQRINQDAHQQGVLPSAPSSEA